MLSQVGWAIPEFVRQLFWLALEPPGPEWGLRMPPLNEGGWYIISSFFLLVSVMMWWVRTYLLAAAAQDGQAHRLGLPGRDLAVPRAGPVPPDPDGIVERGGALRHLPAPRLDHRFLDPLRQTSTTTRSTRFRSCSSTAPCCCSRCTARPSWPSPAMAATASWSRSTTAARLPNGLACSGAGPWASTPRWKAFTAGPGGSRS